MKYQPLPIAATYRRFIALNQKLKRLLASGRFQLLSKPKQQALLLRLRQLFRRLSQVVPIQRLRQGIAVSAIVIAGGKANAQQFAAPEQNPFALGLEQNDNELFPLPQLVDIDGDGDFDLLHRSTFDESTNYGTTVFFQENVGTPDEAVFSELVASPFGLGELGDATILTFGDLDGDGDLDMLTGQYDASYDATYFAYYENTGTPTAPAFGPAVLNPFGLILEDGTDSTAPQLADLDNDGDLDLLVGTYFYNTELTATVYFPNIGTAEAPAFGPPQVNPFGLQLPLESYLFLPALADFDNDGDLDIVSGGSYQYEGDMYLPFLDYYENTGTAQAPSFAPPQRNAFGLQSDLNSLVVIPAAADLDADGDVDVLTSGLAYEEGSGYGKVIFEYFENTAVINTVDFTEAENQLQLFPTVATDAVQWRVGSDIRPEQLWITLFDLAGRPLIQQALQGEAGTLSVSDLPAGLYHARLTDEQGLLLGAGSIVKP
ncbi:MAG: T9SS type A sorting domain-containing protein [Phaeodactylibacter sp.]|uniref:T9SS type A sorting domain-containing protein n=1 Tax=Phaeodactylibacter sp. TaxID=1940289 RepID=UPI0032EBA96F